MSSICLQRRYFDQDQGAELLNKLSIQAIDANILESYTFLASCHALVRYLEANNGLRFLPKSLKVELSYGWVPSCQHAVAHVSLPGYML